MLGRDHQLDCFTTWLAGGGVADSNPQTGRAGLQGRRKQGSRPRTPGRPQSCTPLGFTTNAQLPVAGRDYRLRPTSTVRSYRTLA
ncbi:MAG: hypothetical protein R3C19_06715 [Planctomycetaceae bacterium]